MLKIDSSVKSQIYKRYGTQQRWQLTDTKVEQHDPYLIENLIHLKVCPKCTIIRGDILLDDGTPVWQGCGCIPSQEENWVHRGIFRFDYNRAYETCYCCGLEVINCGSKFSPFYCNDCYPMVNEFNEQHGKVLLPYGRHSLMNGIRANLADSNYPPKVMVDAFNTNNSSVSIVGIHQDYILAKQMYKFGMNESNTMLDFMRETQNHDLKTRKKQALDELIEFRKTLKGPQLAYDIWHELDPKPPVPEEPPFNPHVDNKELKVKFFTLLIKLNRIKESYPGGVEAFIAEYKGIYNDDLYAQHLMNCYDLDDIVADIKSRDLEPKEDFVITEELLFPGLFGDEKEGVLESGVPWLGLRWDQKGTWCSWNG